MLPLEALEPGVARCEPRVLFLELLCFAPHPQGFVPQLLGFALDLLGFSPQLLGFAPQLLRSQLGGVDLLLDVGIVSPVERLQEQAPSRQR